MRYFVGGWLISVVLVCVSSVLPTAQAIVGTAILVQDDDGSATAPVGKPQFAALLQQYARRPQWKVPGVDYAVGPRPGVILKDPAAINMVGVRLDLANRWVLISNDNIILDGFDFTIGGGWTIVVQGRNVTIRDFKVGIARAMRMQSDPIKTLPPADGITLEYGILDGGGARAIKSGWAVIYHATTSGSMRIQFCLIQDAIQHSLDANEPSTIQYNVFHAAMYGFGMHGDFIQAYSSNTVVKFNLFYQPPAGETGFPGGIVAAFNTSVPVSNKTISNVRFNNNTLVGIGATGHLSGPQAIENWVNFTPTGIDDIVESPIVQNNYATMSGNRSRDFVYNEGAGGGPGVRSMRVIDNINMETGSPLPNYPQ